MHSPINKHATSGCAPMVSCPAMCHPSLFSQMTPIIKPTIKRETGLHYAVPHNVAPPQRAVSRNALQTVPKKQGMFYPRKKKNNIPTFGIRTRRAGNRKNATQQVVQALPPKNIKPPILSIIRKDLKQLISLELKKGVKTILVKCRRMDGKDIEKIGMVLLDGNKNLLGGFPKTESVIDKQCNLAFALMDPLPNDTTAILKFIQHSSAQEEEAEYSIQVYTNKY